MTVQIKIPLVTIKQEYFTNTTLHITLQFETLHSYLCKFILDNWDFMEFKSKWNFKNLVLYISSNGLYFTIYKAHVLGQHQKYLQNCLTSLIHTMW